MCSIKNSIFYNGKEFKVFKRNTNYYVSCDGEVYSLYTNRCLRPLIRHSKARKKVYYSVDIYLDGKQRHVPIHRLVYEVWVGTIKEGMQINHIDDNSVNNHYLNLYMGTQKENIHDCIQNGNRVGNKKSIKVYDSYHNKILEFDSIKSLISYSGRDCKVDNLPKCMTKKWFYTRFKVLEFNGAVLSQCESATTSRDECSDVG